MAVTKGQGNPNWAREEVALALELYFANGQEIPSTSDERVISLSEFLRSMNLHGNVSKNEKFRNPSGVIFKIGNLRAVATGKGLQNTAKMDQAVWDEFGSDRLGLNNYCEQIRSGTLQLRTEYHEVDFMDQVEFHEGRVLTKLHKLRERDKNLRKNFIRYLSKSNLLLCELCGVRPKSELGELALKMYECHHVVPISIALENKTKMSDLSFLCANCHRLVHAAIAKKKRWLSIEEARKLLAIRTS